MSTSAQSTLLASVHSAGFVWCACGSIANAESFIRLTISVVEGL